ncbi:MAG: hypothetical protein ACLP1Y_07695 [Candidatus Acidiferrales bacterium]
MNTQPIFRNQYGKPMTAPKKKSRRRWTWREWAGIGIVLVGFLCIGAGTQLNLASQVQGILSGANGGLSVNAGAFTGVLREAAGTASASELSGDAMTSGSNAVTVAKIDGTTVPTNSSADQFLGTTASATAAWASMPNCPSGAIQYTTSTHSFSCGTVLTGSFADAETPSGSISGSNPTFTLAHTPSPAASLAVYLNGVEQRAGGADYTLSTATITFGTSPPSGSTLVAYYRY